MKKIDHKEARLRIMKALVRGHVDVYGLRREVEVEREVMASPGHVFDKDEEWTDPQGIARKGRFKQLPPVKKTARFKVPQGVVPAEIAQWANAVGDGFMEVLNILEEALAEVEPERAREVIHELREAAGG